MQPEDVFTGADDGADPVEIAAYRANGSHRIGTPSLQRIGGPISERGATGTNRRQRFGRAVKSSPEKRDARGRPHQPSECVASKSASESANYQLKGRFGREAEVIGRLQNALSGDGMVE